MSYITNRLLVTGAENLSLLKSKGFLGVWNGLTGIAKATSAESDTFIRLKDGLTPDHFKGFTGFLRKFSESFKALWSKLTGHVEHLIQKTGTPLAKAPAAGGGVTSLGDDAFDSLLYSSFTTHGFGGADDVFSGVADAIF